MNTPGPVAHPAFARCRAVLFDLDGTLLDSAPDLAAAADAVRVARGHASLPLSAYRHACGAGARGLLGVGLALTPEHPDYAAAAEEFFDRYERGMTEFTQPFGGVATLLAQLHAMGLRWGIVTNKAQRFAEPLVAHFAAFDQRGALVSGDTTPHRKPHPQPLLHAAQALRVNPADCLYVGDDERDIKAGHAAGMGTVAAHYGYLGAGADPHRWGAHAHIHTPIDLLQTLAAA
jgi:N-acetyl-D-muramate 6-phosphate phosphatase